MLADTPTTRDLTRLAHELDLTGQVLQQLESFCSEPGHFYLKHPSLDVLVPLGRDPDTARDTLRRRANALHHRQRLQRTFASLHPQAR